MRGEIIVCKDFRGFFLELVLWEDLGRIVLVHTRDQFSVHTARNPHFEAVEFSIEDVFTKDGASGELEPFALSRLQ